VALDAAAIPWTGGQRGVVMRGTGGGATTLNLAPDLRDVWAATATAAWAVGELGSIYRWNGTSWSRDATPTTATLHAVWAAGPGDAFAGGTNGTLLRWTGGSWSAMTFPGTGTVSALWGSSAGNVVATTSTGDVLIYNGSSWRVAQTVPAALWSVWGSTPTALVVSGEGGAVQEQAGTTWTPVTPPATATLAGSWSAGPGDLWVVGAGGDGSTGVAFHRTGGDWSPMAVGTTVPLTAIWGPGQGDLYAVGADGVLLRFNGSSWGAMATGTADLLWSVSGVPGVAGSGVAVGFNTTVVRGTGMGALRAGERVDAPLAGGIRDPLPGTRLLRQPLPSGAARGRRGGR
jgi:hypothetical protein